jgi:hypothetical protein
MVAREEIHLHSSVHQRLQGSKYTDVSFRHYIPILIPEIPHIPQHIQCCSLLRQRLKERDKSGLPGRRIIHIQPEMNVGNEICKLSRHAKMKMQAAAMRQ